MIIREDLDGFIRHYSDQNLLIRKVGTDEIYDDAMDVLDYQYGETDIPLKGPNRQRTICVRLSTYWG